MGKRNKRKKKKEGGGITIFFFLLDVAGPTQCACMFNDRVCQRTRACECFQSPKVQLCTPNVEKKGRE